MGRRGSVYVADGRAYSVSPHSRTAGNFGGPGTVRANLGTDCEHVLVHLQLTHTHHPPRAPPHLAMGPWFFSLGAWFAAGRYDAER